MICRQPFALFDLFRTALHVQASSVSAANPASATLLRRLIVYVDNALNRRLGRVGKPYGKHHHHAKTTRLADGQAKTMRLADGTRVRLFNGDYQVIKPTKKKTHKGGKKLSPYAQLVKDNYHTKTVMSAGGPRDRMRKLG